MKHKNNNINTLDSLHSDSLRIFFLTEMWERYGFYVVQTLLVLYLTFYFHWRDAEAFQLVGTFTAMTYISALIGGWIADHLLGQKRAIIVATILLITSYIVLAVLHSKHGLLMSLAGVCVGTGLLKPNISSLLGNTYPPNSPDRERGFTLFYIGITLGIFLGSTIPNIIHQYCGWSVAFLSAAIGMLFSCAVFSYGIYRYKIEDYNPYEYQISKLLLTPLLIVALYIGVLNIFDFPAIANITFIAIVLFSVAYVVYAVKTEKGQQSYQNIIIGLLCIISTLFWAFYFQMYSSFSLLITRIVNPYLFGITFPAPYYVAIQSLGIILFGYLLIKPKKHATIAMQATNIGKKFSMAMWIITLAYAVATSILYFDLSSALFSPLLIIPIYLMISGAEVLLSPVGLSAITLLSSPKKVSTMMGIFFVSLGAGGFLSGKIAILAAVPSAELPIAALKLIYAEAFAKMLGLLIIATLLCWFVQYLIKSYETPSKTYEF